MSNALLTLPERVVEHHIITVQGQRFSRALHRTLHMQFNGTRSTHLQRHVAVKKAGPTQDFECVV